MVSRRRFANFESGVYRVREDAVRASFGANGGPEARRFVDFLRSPPGVKALREAETLPGAE